MKNKIAVYIRVSTTHQIDKESLPFQRRELENYAKYVLNIDDMEFLRTQAIPVKILCDLLFNL